MRRSGVRSSSSPPPHTTKRSRMEQGAYFCIECKNIVPKQSATISFLRIALQKDPWPRPRVLTFWRCKFALNLALPGKSDWTQRSSATVGTIFRISGPLTGQAVRRGAIRQLFLAAPYCLATLSAAFFRRSSSRRASKSRPKRASRSSIALRIPRRI
jgi:hypothetical protein